MEEAAHVNKGPEKSQRVLGQEEALRPHREREAPGVL